MRAHDAMRVIVLGPPGSGKSTHARLLADRLSATHVSVGAALRREVAAQSPLGIRVAAKVDAGELADTTDVLEVLKDPLMAATRSGGWVLDGAPRTVAQAAVLDEWLDVLRAPADCVVALDVPVAELRERLVRRGRTDDSPDVIAHRLRVWEEDGCAVLEWYELTGRLVRVDATGEVEDVALRVRLAVLGDERTGGETA